MTASSSSPRNPKRVITGQREDGTSYFARIETVAVRGAAGGEGVQVGSFKMWASDTLPVLLPTDGRAPTLRSHPTPDESPGALMNNPSPHPGLLGYRANLIKFPPASEGKNFFAGLHWHDTCDLLFVIEGELTVGLDGGEEVTAFPGDLLVQNGTNHWWRSGPAGATLGLTMIGAKRFAGPEPSREQYVDHSSALPDEIDVVLLDRIERGEPNQKSQLDVETGFFRTDERPVKTER